jgi:uncharacterized CHY-type Zn-finger protein
MNSCVDCVSHSKVKVEENGRKAIFLNPNRECYSVGRIDGCLVKDGIRADFFVATERCAVIVELKGCDVTHACEQLFAAVDNHAVNEFVKGKKLGFIIICSRFPSNSTSVQIAQSKARKRYKAGFHVCCNMREFNIEAV